MSKLGLWVMMLRRQIQASSRGEDEDIHTISSNNCCAGVWWYRPTLRRLREEGCPKFQATFDYTTRPCCTKPIMKRRPDTRVHPKEREQHTRQNPEATLTTETSPDKHSVLDLHHPPQDLLPTSALDVLLGQQDMEF